MSPSERIEFDQMQKQVNTLRGEIEVMKARLMKQDGDINRLKWQLARADILTQQTRNQVFDDVGIIPCDPDEPTISERTLEMQGEELRGKERRE